jgi:hypothetical protein
MKQLDPVLVDAMLRMIGGVFFASCDSGADVDKAIDSLRRFAAINFDNPACFKLCHSLADAQEDAIRARHCDLTSVKTAGAA